MGTKMNKWMTKLETLEKTWKKLETNMKQVGKTWKIVINFVDQLLGTQIQLTYLVLSLFMGTKMNKWMKHSTKVGKNLKKVGKKLNNWF